MEENNNIENEILSIDEEIKAEQTETPKVEKTQEEIYDDMLEENLEW